MPLYWLLVLTSTCSLYLYLFLSIAFFNDFFEQKKYASIFFALSLITNSVFIYTARILNLDAYLTFLITLLIMYVTMKLVFKVSKTIAYYGAIRSTFYMYSIRALVISVIALILRRPILDVWMDSMLYVISFQIALILTTLVLFMKIWTFMSKDRMRVLFRNEDQLNFVLFIKTILGLFLMVFTYGARYTSDTVWFATVHLLTCLMVILIAIYALWNALKVVSLIEYETRTKSLETQLQMQVNHYKSYQKYTDTFREFRHDYNKALSVVNGLLRNHKNEEAIRILDEMGVQMSEGVAAHKEYSNNILLDAVLQEYANKVHNDQVHFECMIYWVDSIEIEDLALVRLFSNILTNAHEATILLEPKNRWIKVESKMKKHWLNIQVSNSFDGKLKENLESTKAADSASRGLGIGITQSIVEDLGGIFQWTAVEGVFTLNINFPLSETMRPNSL